MGASAEGDLALRVSVLLRVPRIKLGRDVRFIRAHVDRVQPGPREVEVVLVAAAGEGGVAPFAAQAGAGEYEREVDGHALGDVTGDRVAVLDRWRVGSAT